MKYKHYLPSSPTYYVTTYDYQTNKPVILLLSRKLYERLLSHYKEARSIY
jgi:hypothetical protein